jgi:hypothetical protein
MPFYERIQTKQLLHSFERMSSSLSHLLINDSASFILTDGGQVNFNTEFKLLPESIDELLTKERITCESEMILKVKKPDYLGESKWDFRHGGRSFPAKISHSKWLEEFQNREKDVRPGDSIRAKVEVVNKYDYDGELVGTDYTILDVMEVIPGPKPNQVELFEGNVPVKNPN